MERAVIHLEDTVKRCAKWAIKANRGKAALEKRGAKVLYQTEITKNGKSDDLVIAAEGERYTVRINSTLVGSYRTFEFAVMVARDRGLLSNYEAVKMTRGKAAAEREQKIRTIRTLLK